MLNLTKNIIAPIIERQLTVRIHSREKNKGCNMSVANNRGNMSGNANNAVHLFH